MTFLPALSRWRGAAALAVATFLGAAQAGILDQPLTPEQFQACVQQLAGETATAGRPLARADFLRIAAGARYDDRVRQSMLVTAGEPSFWWDELAATTDDQRVADGRAVLARAGETLSRIEARFGVPREIV